MTIQAHEGTKWSVEVPATLRGANRSVVCGYATLGASIHQDIRKGERGDHIRREYTRGEPFENMEFWFNKPILSIGEVGRSDRRMRINEGVLL